MWRKRKVEDTRVCDKCGILGIEEHHIVPRRFGGNGYWGERIFVCKKHHPIIDNIMTKIAWGFVPKDKKDEARRKMVSYTKWWVKQGEK